MIVLGKQRRGKKGYWVNSNWRWQIQIENIIHIKKSLRGIPSQSYVSLQPSDFSTCQSHPFPEYRQKSLSWVPLRNVHESLGPTLYPLKPHRTQSTPGESLQNRWRHRPFSSPFKCQNPPQMKRGTRPKH